MEHDLRQELLDYVATEYGTKGDHPFKRFPQYTILRHEHNRKWYAALMMVPKDKLGLAGVEEVPLVNLKVKPELALILQAREGIFPAYHMNKENWLSVLLTGVVPLAEIIPLLDDSYFLTR